MISHEFIAGKSKTDYPQQTLQINTNGIQDKELIATIRYLIDNIYIIYEKNKEINEDVMWPICIQVNNCLTMSESVFWKYVFENVKSAHIYLHEYIQKLVTLANTTADGMLLQSNEYHFHGSLGFNQYWLWSIENPFPDTDETTMMLHDFAFWLGKNDLGYEVTQDDCINTLMHHFSHYDNDAMATLLALRLNDGQLNDKGFDYLIAVLMHINSENRKGLLKKTVDQLLNDDLHLNGSCTNEAVIYQLCAIVYGSNEQCTNVVMDYAKKVAKTELWPTQEFQMKKINYLRQVGDLYWQQVTSRNRYIDTSFHLFDTHTRKWIDYDERE